MQLTPQTSAPFLPNTQGYLLLSFKKFDLVLRKQIGSFFNNLFFNSQLCVLCHRAVAFQDLCVGITEGSLPVSWTLCRPPHPYSRGALGQRFLKPSLLFLPHPCSLRFGHGLEGMVELLFSGPNLSSNQN